MNRTSITRMAAAAALMLAGCGVVAWCLLTAVSALHLAGLGAAPQLRDLAVLAGIGIAAWFCAGATLFGLGLRLVLW